MSEKFACIRVLRLSISSTEWGHVCVQKLPTLKLLRTEISPASRSCKCGKRRWSNSPSVNR